MGRAIDNIGVYARAARRNLSDARPVSALVPRTRQYLPGRLMLIVADLFFDRLRATAGAESPARPTRGQADAFR